jgi:hypothetical protein
MEDPKRTREIRDAIANGRNPYGMMTFDQCLTDLVLRKFITYETALSNSTTPDDFALTFRGVNKGSEAAAEARQMLQQQQQKPAQAPPGPPPPVRQDPAEAPLELDRRPPGRR